MKKQKKLLGIVALVLVAVGLLGIYLLLTKKSEEPKEPAGDKVIRVVTIDAQAVEKISIEPSGAERICLVKSSEQWQREGSAVFPINQSVASLIVDSLLSNLNALKELDKPAELSQYGLEQPKSVLKAYQGEQCLVTIKLGDKVPNADAYYAMFDDSDKVYTVASNYERYMMLTWDGLMESITLPTISDVEQIRSVSIESTIYTNFEAFYDEENPYDYSGSHMFNWYFGTPYDGYVNADYTNTTWYTQLSNYSSYPYVGVVRYGLDGLEQYGLDQPNTTLTVSFMDGTAKSTITLYLGNEDENGNVYGYFNDIDWVFLFSKTIVENRVKAQTYTWSYLKPFWPNTNLMKQMTVEAEGNTYTLLMNHSEDGDTATWNGKDCTEILSDIGSDLFNIKYSKLVSAEEKEKLGLSANDGEANAAILQNNFGEPIICFEIVMTEGLAGSQVEVYAYDDEYCIICVNGNVNFLCDKRDIESYIMLMKLY